MSVLLVVELPAERANDGAELHYARVGHANTLCGIDWCEGDEPIEPDADGALPVPDCSACLALASLEGYQHPIGGS